MKKNVTVITFLVSLFSVPMAHAGFGWWGLPPSDPGQSIADSSAETGDQLVASSTEETEKSFVATEVVTVVLAGVGAVSCTIYAISYTIRASRANKESVLKLQDQIYMAEGKDYRAVIDFFEIEEVDLIKANDELVVAGYQITTDQEAIDYLKALIQKLAEKSGNKQYEVSLL